MTHDAAEACRILESRPHLLRECLAESVHELDDLLLHAGMQSKATPGSTLSWSFGPRFLLVGVQILQWLLARCVYSQDPSQSILWRLELIMEGGASDHDIEVEAPVFPGTYTWLTHSSASRSFSALKILSHTG